MKPENVIEVDHVTKKFKVYFDKGHTLKEKALFRSRRSYEERMVLNGLSFTVKRGEAVGLIGHNGCGKSTTLKILAKIMYPDSGTIRMSGRISSLLELGAGFHPDLSGRENIYINASIFGMTRKEIDQKIQDIIRFSELESFIDQPVRTYSSGMYMRLAFSVAINVNADILLIDEILAVGDASFQAKCFNKLRELKADKVTIIIVSHSLSQIEQICDRNIWIHEGKVQMEGSPAEVDYAYIDYMGKQAKSAADEMKEDVLVQSDEADSQEEKHAIEIIRAELVHADGRVDQRFQVGEKVVLRINYKKNAREELTPLLGIKIYRNDGTNAYGTNTQNERMKLQLYGKGWIECCFEKLNLTAAVYYLDLAFRTQDMLIYDYKTKIQMFETYGSIYEEGIAHLDHSWAFKGEDA